MTETFGMAFFWTGISWWLAAIVLPRVARWGYDGEGWLGGIWLIASGSALVFIALVLLLRLSAIPMEPVRVLGARYLAMLLVTMGLYTLEFAKGSTRKARGGTQ